MYGLVEFRLVSLDRRAMLAWAGLTAFLTCFSALSGDAQWSLLIGAPMALLWLLRTTINHARSFEDALRRLDEIERAVNQLAGSELLAFQSRHPSRGWSVGGRTGTETVLTILATSLVMLFSCGFLGVQHGDVAPPLLAMYVGYLGVATVYFMYCVFSLRRYQYRKADAPPAPPLARIGLKPPRIRRTRRSSSRGRTPR